jgi:hypothetical protein
MEKLLKTTIGNQIVYTIPTEAELENFDSIVSLEPIELVDSTPELEALVVSPDMYEDKSVTASNPEPEEE